MANRGTWGMEREKAGAVVSETALLVCEQMERWAAAPSGVTCIDEAFLGELLDLDRLAVRGALRELEDCGAIDRAGGALYVVRSQVAEVRR